MSNYNRNKFNQKFLSISNDQFTLLSEYKNQRTYIIVKHNKCGKTFKVRPDNFLATPRCRCCEMQVPLTQKIIIERMGELNRSDYVLIDYKINKNRKIKVKHLDCGQTFEVYPHHFLNKSHPSNCPYCSHRSRGEESIKTLLDDYDISYERQYVFSDCRFIRPLKFDFAIFNASHEVVACIEFDGEQHSDPLHYGREILKSTKMRDSIKDRYCLDNAIDLIRITKESFNSLESISSITSSLSN